MDLKIDNSKEVIEVNKHDIKLIFEAICFYDMHHQEEMSSNLNNSFHYLYGKTSEVGLNYGI